MPRGDKSAYTAKQKRQAEHIEESYKQRGLSTHAAEARARATVNQQDHGGKLSGSGHKPAAGKKPKANAVTKAGSSKRAPARSSRSA